MKIRIIMLSVVCFALFGKAHAQWAVFDPTNLAQSIVNTSKNVVQTSTTAQNMVNNFKETVKIYQQGKQYYDALKSVNNLVKDGKKVQKTVLLIGEISDIYVTNFQKMLADKNYSSSELSAIASGYTRILEESTDVFAELKTVVSSTGLSMTDKERMELVDKAYNEVKHFRDLTDYYTRKNISVSYMRSKNTGDLDRVVNLYGTDKKYW